MTTANTIESVESNVASVAFAVTYSAGGLLTVENNTVKTSYRIGESYSQWLTRLGKAPSEAAQDLFKTVRQTAWRFNEAHKGEIISVKRQAKLVKDTLTAVSVETAYSKLALSRAEIDAWHARQQGNAAKRAEKLQQLASMAKMMAAD